MTTALPEAAGYVIVGAPQHGMMLEVVDTLQGAARPGSHRTAAGSVALDTAYGGKP